MPPGDMEAIFVDDGSTDGTGARLDALAAEHEHVTVVHIPNSGWPGRPRNIGLDRARGDHVLFVDNDDWLDPEALERLHAAALRDDADIVIPKVVGHGKGVPRELFRHNRTGATLLRDPILSLLTPHKLFRRAFLVEQGLRFPEGRRRLEDHVFVVPAYFAARGITVVSDHPLYHWVGRDDGTNASVRPLTASYFDDLREVLDLVEERTEPGAVRDRLLAHWYRSKVLARLGSARLLGRPPEQRPELFEACRALARERFGPAVSARVGAPLRIRARLLTEGSLDGLEALAEAERPLDPGIRLERAGWDGDVLRLELSAAPVDGAGAPLAFRRVSSRFGMRHHPVLGVWKMHTGTDYAAASGTPVRTVGDGVVAFAGWKGGYGNVLEVRHPNGYVSRYGHLRGFATGVRRGARVAMGRTIGYVGTTGLSTAPHLHFELLVGGAQRDPGAALRRASEDVIAGSERAAFDAKRARLLGRLAGGAGASSRVASAE